MPRGAASAAVRAAYPALSLAGRRRALDVIDHADCADAGPLYADALCRLRRRAAPRRRPAATLRGRRVAAFTEVMAAQDAEGDRAATLLAELAPVALTDYSASSRPSPAARRPASLARAVASPAAEPIVGKPLAPTSPRPQLELLGPVTVAPPPPSRSESAVRGALAQPDFRSRYLLLEPAAHLEAKDD